MFGIGIFELLLIFFIALIVLGPTQLPEVARQIGVWYYQLKKVAHSAQTQMEDEFHKIEKQATSENDQTVWSDVKKNTPDPIINQDKRGEKK